MEIIVLGIIITVIWGLITRVASGGTSTRQRHYDPNSVQDDTWMHHNMQHMNDTMHHTSFGDSGMDAGHFHSCDCDPGGFDGGCDCGGID